MKIVLVMTDPPLPFGNAAARWYYVLLRELVARGHEVVTLAASSKATDEAEARQLFPADKYNLRIYPMVQRTGFAAKLRSLRQPFAYIFSDEMKRDLAQELARGFDILHLEQLWCGWLGLEHTSRALLNVHHLQTIDLAEAPMANWKNRWSRHQVNSTERHLLRKYRYIRSCSPRIVDMIRQHSPQSQIRVIPVGMDASLYRYIPPEKRTLDPVVTLVGSMGWYPSYSAGKRLITRLWPEIRRQVPDARLKIVGWSARSVLKEHLETPGLEVFENVADIQPYFEEANVFLYAPARGSGMKIKILECMLFGVPVVTTSEGIEGLPAQDGVEASVCEDDAGLIDRTVQLLRDPERRERQRLAARAMVESHCGPDATVSAIEAFYQQIQRDQPA